jgi:hypothetical protein
VTLFRRRRARSWFIAVTLGVIVGLMFISLSSYQSSIQPLRLSQSVIRRSTLSSLESTKLLPAVQNYLKTTMAMNILGRTLLGSAWPIRHIPVCWEAPDPQFEAEMGWTKDAVVTSWQSHSAITFDGWGTCTDKAPGVHLQVSDVPPEARGIGKALDTENNGVLLNFVMKAVVLPCSQYREACIRTTAIHEFGHVLGLTHEDFNPLAPAFCVANSAGPTGNKPLTPYDPDSVMGYCTLLDGKPHLPSSLDITSVNLLYPVETPSG